MRWEFQNQIFIFFFFDTILTVSFFSQLIEDEEEAKTKKRETEEGENKYQRKKGGENKQMVRVWDFQRHWRLFIYTTYVYPGHPFPIYFFLFFSFLFLNIKTKKKYFFSFLFWSKNGKITIYIVRINKNRAGQGRAGPLQRKYGFPFFYSLVPVPVPLWLTSSCRPSPTLHQLIITFLLFLYFIS